MRENLLLTSALLSRLLLCGCGHGSGSDRRNYVAETLGEVVDPPGDTGSAETGFLIDSAVSGVTYETPTHQAVTGLDGSFEYEKGETDRFIIDATLLGEVTGRSL